MCACNHFIYPAANRPDWITAAAGFSHFYVTISRPPEDRAISCLHSGAPPSSAPQFCQW